MLQLVTPATEAASFARRQMPGLHEFLYTDATEFAEKASKTRTFRMGGDWNARAAALTGVAVGFLYGEVVALTDHRDEEALLADVPVALVGHPVWDRTIQMVGSAPASPVALAVAMEHVMRATGGEGIDDLPSTMGAAFHAYGTVMGYERGRERLGTGTALPLPPRETVTFMETLDRLLAIAARASVEAEGQLGGALDALYGDDEDGREAFRQALVRSCASYATNAILSMAHEGHLACSPRLVVGRMRAWASQFARGMLEASIGKVDATQIVEAMFAEDGLRELTLAGEPLPDAVRGANPRMCNEPLTEAMLPLAMARARMLAYEYGDPGEGPADFRPTGLDIAGTPVYACVDPDERIVVSAIAYACGVRKAHEEGTVAATRKAQDAAKAWEATGQEWEEAWDIDAHGSLPAWLALSASHPDWPAGKVGDGQEAEGEGEAAQLGNGTDGNAMPAEEMRKGFRLV